MASARLAVPPETPSCPALLERLVRPARFKRPAASETTPDPAESKEPAAAPEPPPLGGLLGIAERIFGLDVRSLALFRIVLGLLMIFDLLYRAQDLKAHYTDAGILPIALVSVGQQQHWWWTIHSLHPALALEVVLFLIAGLFSLSLILGYRTRMVSIVCWFLLVSVQNRNTMVLTGGDTMIRMMAFWAMFLPLNACWSVDRLLDRSDTPLPKRIFSVASTALVMQFALIYLCGALLKTGPTWRVNHEATFYALSLGQFATPLAKALLPHRDLLRTLTFLTWNLEFLAPFLLLASSFSGPLRTVVVLAYMGFHISLGECLELGLFPIIGALSWLVLMPNWFWLTLSRLANRFSWKTPAFVSALAARLNLWRPYLRPQSPTAHTPRIVSVVVGFFLLYVLAWNIRTLNFKVHQQWFPISINWIGEVMRIDQSWELFAPDPMQIEEWIVVPATLKDGEVVDLKSGARQVSYEPPPRMADTYYNERWRKYLMNIADSRDQGNCFTYAAYLCNRWNDSHPAEQRVEEVSIYVERRQILPSGRYAPIEQVLLFKGDYSHSNNAAANP